MNPLLIYALKLTALGLKAKANGWSDDLKARWDELVAEAQDSVLEPQDNGEPWTEAAILAWFDEHERLAAELKARHAAPPAGPGQG